MDDFESALAAIEDDGEYSGVDVMQSPGIVGTTLAEIQREGVAGQIVELDRDTEEQEKLNQLARWQKTVIAALRLKGNLSLACRAASVSLNTVKKYREQSPIFDELCEQALTYNDDLVEGRAYQLGVEGYFEPVYQGGVLVGKRHVISERLLEVMLKARKPKVFAPDKSMKLEVNAGGATVPVMEVSQVAELVRGLAPTLAAGVLASRQKVINGSVTEIKPVSPTLTD